MRSLSVARCSCSLVGVRASLFVLHGANGSEGTSCARHSEQRTAMHGSTNWQGVRWHTERSGGAVSTFSLAMSKASFNIRGPSETLSGNTYLRIGWAVLLTTLTPLSATAQSDWEIPGIPFKVVVMLNICPDTIGNALYFCGESSLNNDNDSGDGAIPVYANGQWDTLSVFHGAVSSTVRWHDTLIVSGSFNNINGIPIDRIGAYANGSWSSYGSLSSGGWIYRLKVIDDELYALGVFESMDGNLCNGLARREGNSWVSAGSFDVFEVPNIQDLVKWNGQLVSTGTIRFNNTTAKEVAILNGTQWEPLGPGIQGSFGAGRSLAVYQGDLYVGGSIDLAAGNAGHGIMRWDGSQYQPVGTGLQTFYNNYQYIVGAIDMKVHNDKLWVGGNFGFAGNVLARGVASWDGTQWCGLPDISVSNSQLPVEALAFFHDTLYVSTYDSGLPANCALRFIGTDYQDTCSVPVGLPALEVLEDRLSAFPIPAQHVVKLQGLHDPSQASCALFDLQGRELPIRWQAQADGLTIHRDGLPEGCYLLRIVERNAPSRAARIIFEEL